MAEAAAAEAAQEPTGDQPAGGVGTLVEREPRLPESRGSGTWRHLVIRPRQLVRGARQTEDGSDYELVRVLGHGAMGVVYAARQKSINRSVAVKMLHPQLAEDPQQRERFLAEAVVTGDLGHPNIVPIYDLAINQAGELFYSMKEVGGTPWHLGLAHKTLMENLEIWMRVADAVAFAHDRGVIHRDLKPENVMVGQFGEVLLMDWGIAVSREMLADPEVRSSSAVGGTPAYMAPEMGREGPLHRLGPAADIYLLGAILYEIITGHPPHSGADVISCLRAAVRNEIQPTTKSGELLDIALRAMATNPADRFASVQEMQAAVREHLSHAQSDVLVVRGDEHLERAEQSGDYTLYQQAILAFGEAQALWPNNQRAAVRLDEARLACARRALQTGDYDLGLSVLDPQAPGHVPLIKKLKARRRQRSRGRALVRSLAIAIVVVSVGAAVWINAERREAYTQRLKAEDSAREAVENARQAKINAEKAKEEADRADAEAAEAGRLAVEAQDAATFAQDQQRIAENQRKIADDQRRIADDNAEAARRQALIASARADEAMAAAYRSKIVLAASQVDADAFSRAALELDQIARRGKGSKQFTPPPWEYNRLRYMLDLSEQKIDTGFPLHAATVTPDGRSTAVGGGAGRVLVYRGAEKPLTVETGLQQVAAVVFSASGRRLITAGSTASRDDQGRTVHTSQLAVWDVKDGQRLHAFPGRPGDRVRSLAVAGPDDALQLVAGIEQPGAAPDELTTDVARIWQPDREPVLLVGHHRAVLSVAISPDAQTIISADEMGILQVWQRDGESFVLLREKTAESFRPHGGEPVYAVQFSPDGQQVATAGGDRQIHLWRTADLLQPEAPPAELAPQTTLSGHAAAVLAVGFRPDGRQLVSGGEDGTLRVWDLEQGQTVTLLRGHSNAVRSCGFFPDDPDRIYSAAADQQLRVWSLSRYSEALTIRAESLPDLLSASFSPDGRRLVTAHRRLNHGAAAVWDLEFTGNRPALVNQTPRRLCEGHTVFVFQARPAPGPERPEVLTIGADGVACFWDPLEGGERLRIDGVSRSLNYGSPSVVTSADGRWILAAAGERTVHLWDRQQLEADPAAPPHQVLGPHRGPVTAVAISRSARLLFSGDELGAGTLWTAGEDGRFASAWAVEPSNAPAVSAAWFAPDESRLFCVWHDQVRQFDTASGQEYKEGRLGHTADVASTALSSDGQRLLVGCADGSLSLWDVSRPEASGKPLDVIRDPQQGRKIQAVDISADGRWALEVATNTLRVYGLTREGTFAAPREFAASELEAESGAFYGDDGSQIVVASGVGAELWDLQEPQPRRLQQFVAESEPTSVRFSQDGRLVVTAHTDGAVKLWDAVAGRVLRRLQRSHRGSVHFAGFAADDQLLWTAGEDGQILRWRVDSGALVDRFGPQENGLPIYHLAFSPAGDLLAAAAEDGSVTLWDLASGTPRAVLQGHTGAARHVAFSPDGRWLASCGEDQTARLWDVHAAGEVFVLHGHRQRVNSVSFSPDGRRLVTGSADGTAKVWAIQPAVPLPPADPPAEAGEYLTGGTADAAPAGGTEIPLSVDELLTLRKHRGEVSSVEFSADGRTLLTAGRDGQAIVWPSVSGVDTSVAQAPPQLPLPVLRGVSSRQPSH